MIKNVAVLLLAGDSTRFMRDCGEKKQFIKIKGVPSFVYPLRSLIKSSIFDKIILVCNNSDIEKTKSICNEFGITNNLFFVVGGTSRNESVKNSLGFIAENFPCKNVFIHDSARVILPINIIKSLNDKLLSCDAVVPVLKTNDSVLYKGEYLNRDEVLQIQTPQAFDFYKLYDIYSNEYDTLSTDDFSKAKKVELKCDTVSGTPLLIKLTYFDDLKIIEKFIN